MHCHSVASRPAIAKTQADLPCAGRNVAEDRQCPNSLTESAERKRPVVFLPRRLESILLELPFPAEARGHLSHNGLILQNNLCVLPVHLLDIVVFPAVRLPLIDFYFV